MNILIHKLLKVLKEHVNQNNREIQFNQEEIDKLLSDISLGARKQDIDGKYAINRQLLNENSDFVKMQLELSDFFEKYRHHFPDSLAKTNPNEPMKSEAQILLMKTVSGKLKFDDSHPQYNNPLFFKELLQYFESREDYEMCDKLLKIRKL